MRLLRAFAAFFRENVPVLIFLALVVNGILIFLIERDRRPRVVYHVERIYTATNSPSSSSVTSRHVVDAVSSAPVPIAPAATFPDLSVYYRYYEINGVPGVVMYGCHYKVGSVTSRGIISLIFPDRIMLDSGQWLVNSWNYSHQSFITNTYL